MGEGDLRATLQGVTRRDQAEPVTTAAGLDKGDEIICQRHGFRPHRTHRHPVPGIKRGIQRNHAEHRRRAALILRDIGGGAIGGCEIERVGMAEPAAQRLLEPALVARRGVEEGRCPRSAIQIFVAAANGKIDIAAFQIDRQRAGRMRQIPDHQRTGILRRAGQRRHVMHATVAVIHMGEHQHRDIAVQRRCDLLRPVDMDKPVMPATLPDHPFGNVIVGREIAGLGDDFRAAGLQRHRR